MRESGPTFGDLLRQLRRASGQSQGELAERSGLSRRGISDLERGLSHAPRLETVRLLADGLSLRTTSGRHSSPRRDPRWGRTVRLPAAASLPAPYPCP